MLKATETQIPLAAQILAQGFFRDPMIAFIFPESKSRSEALQPFFQIFLTDAVKRGEVRIAPENKGVIAWYPNNVAVFDEQFKVVTAELSEVTLKFGGLAALERLEKIRNQLESCEPTEPHCEVLWLGIVPEARGQGIGQELLSPVLNYADEQQVGCYLASSNLRNLAFYERQGFGQLFPIPITHTLSLTGMWRNAISSG